MLIAFNVKLPCKCPEMPQLNYIAQTFSVWKFLIKSCLLEKEEFYIEVFIIMN